MSKNTVRRLRLREDVDVSLANTEAVANVFGLSLAEFVSAPGQDNGLDADEIVLIHKYRMLKNLSIHRPTSAEVRKWHSFAIFNRRASIMGRDTQIRTFIFIFLLTRMSRYG